jgi:short-subunit dehydrogenase
VKKAIVIGATSGIGKEVAKLLAQNGYLVGITGRRTQLLEELRTTNPNQFITQTFDCVTANNAEELDHLAKQLGGLDLFFLSSGVGHLNRALDYQLEDETNQLNVNAFTQIVVWAYNYFNSQGSGHLAVITSLAGLRGGRAAPAYNASKAYQINYLEALRQRVTNNKSNLVITDLRAGFVATGMAQGDGIFWVAPVKKAAKQIVSAIQQKRAVVYITKRWRFIGLLLKVFPRFVYNRF